MRLAGILIQIAAIHPQVASGAKFLSDPFKMFVQSVCYIVHSAPDGAIVNTAVPFSLQTAVSAMPALWTIHLVSPINPA
jgi:hypothetical protein